MTSSSYKAARAVAKRKYKQRTERRDFLICMGVAVFFITANLALAAWAWPKIAALRKKQRDRMKQRDLSNGK